MPPIQTFTSLELTRDVGAAKRAAAKGPVFITDRGKPVFALLRIDEYHRLTGRQSGSLLDLMYALPATEAAEFEAPRVVVPVRPGDLSETQPPPPS